MDYIGEHRLPGQFGHFFIVLSLVASLVATFSYFKSAQSKNDIDGGYWKKLARYAFITECISVFSIFAILFYIISNHLFEYKYAWQHSSRSLEVKYLLACFWEGQEGSFLLWSVWHCVLGLILIKTTKKWESSVMTVVSFAQFCLATMLAGLYVFGHKIGSNPFILLRESEVFSSAPGMHIDFDINNPVRPDYMSLKQMQDGNDLNPLLQNYWMVIHPPVLFLGFASTIVPFAFAIAGLWTKKFGEWIKPALPWTLFSAAVFGIGIMMGAAWAYEALTFGGYWAWDPVENASLVPWLILVSGIHTMLIYKHSGHSLRSSFLFLILSFFFVLYSTFLTRSGILGETSVHAFTDLGMNLQLLLYLLIFSLPAFVLFASRYRDIPAIHKEENSSSREFWMFIGSLVFFLSALVIIGKTSLPVFNKIFGTKIAPPEDQEYAYNQIQIFVAIILGLLTAVGQYLRYKQTPLRSFWKGIGIPTIIATVVAALVLQFGDINYNKQTGGFLIAIWVAVAAAVYAIIANAAYLWVGLKGKLKLSGGSISHLGFGCVLLGILLSSSKKEILSYNRGGIPIALGADPKEAGENLTLIKGFPMEMGKYDVTYVSDSIHPKKQQWYYTIHFKSRTDDEEFTLKPNAFVNYKGNEGLMANPDSKHYWDHDVFTYISEVPNPDRPRDTSSFQTKTLKPGDSVFYSQGYMVLEDVKARDNLPVELFGTDGSLHEAPVRIFSKTGSIFSLTPTLAKAKGNLLAIPDTVASEGLILRLEKVNPDKTIELGLKESDAVLQYVVLKAYKFPFINLLWFGVILTAIGIFISMARRISLNRLSANR
jgi:cytochrome c-type biogenesis protein CcmF